MKTGCSIRILHAAVNDGKYGVRRGRPIMRLRLIYFYPSTFTLLRPDFLARLRTHAMSPFKTLLLIILGSLVSTGAALALYDFFLERHEQERRQEMIREINAGIEKKRQKAQEEAVDAVTEYAARRAEEQEQKRRKERLAAVAEAVDQERLRQGIGSAAVLRAGITEYFAANGVMPGSLDALGYDAGWTPSNVLESVDIQAGGVIVLRFAPRPRGEVVLIPDRAADLIRGWQCESKDFPGIEQIADCRFTGSIY